jgi:probable HAF family extracellular repeat protein
MSDQAMSSLRSPRTRRGFLLIVIFCVTCAPLRSAHPASFQGLGYLLGGGESSSADGISADGSVVVGYSDSASGNQAFRWTNDGGMVGLGDLPGGNFGSGATGVSADGSVVVGSGASVSGTEAFRWTIVGGMVGLGDLPGGYFRSYATGVSADGSVVVGESNSASHPTDVEVFRWTSGGGMRDLGDLPGGNRAYSAGGVSADGSVVVGQANPPPGIVPEAYRWTSTGSMVGLGDLPGGSTYSWATGVSADGSVVVGAADSGNYASQAFRWTSGGGMVGLGDLPGGNFNSFAEGVSANGSVVVGESVSASGSEAFRWTSAGGMVNLKDDLVAHGVENLEGWRLTEANGVSENGRVIVGYGINPQGKGEAWLAKVDQVVVLRWGQDSPVSFEHITDVTGKNGVVKTNPVPAPHAGIGVENTPEAQAFRHAVMDRVQQIFSAPLTDGGAGLQSLRVTDVPTPDAVDVYFIDPFEPLEPHGFSGRVFFGAGDYGNKMSLGQVTVAIHQLNVDDVAETIAHEVAHTLGLEHLSAMQGYTTDIMEAENHVQHPQIFHNAQFDVVDSYGNKTGDTSNPVFYLEHYIDGISRETLRQQNILPGTYDVDPPTVQEMISMLLSNGHSDQVLYDVTFATSSSDDGGAMTAIAHFDTITLRNLSKIEFAVRDGDYFQVLAKSSISAALPDIVLATGDPFVDEAVQIQLHLGMKDVFLQQLLDGTSAYQTLGVVSIGVHTEAADVNFDGVVNIFDINLLSSHWGETGPTGDANLDSIVDIFDINLISANWTPTVTTAVPEPATWILALLVGIAFAPAVKRARRSKP